ncbi:curli assembly protein CsgF [Myroides sp. LJL116]
MRKIIFLTTLLWVGFCYSQQLSYKPISPFFGGETFNYQMILSSAQAQNSFKEKKDEKETKNSQQVFEERINNQLMNQLSRELFEESFSNGIKEGVFTIGTLSIEIFETKNGTVINMLNTVTGEFTQITMPNN